ncbi:MAG: uroporphyrinogen-III synthase, partial [Methanosarcinales archaeon]
GEVVKLHKELKKPTIAIMRPSRYTAETVKLVEDMGFKPIVFPMIELVDKYDSNFDGFVDRVLQNKSDYVLFTSANGIDYTLRKIKNQEEFIKALNNIKVIAIGPKTKSALEKYNIKVDIVPDKYSSSGLAETIKGVKGKVIEIVRSSHGDPTLIPNLENNGAIVHETQVYEIKTPKDAEELIKKTLNKEIDIFAFTSTMMVKNFMQTASAMEVKEDIIKILNSKIVTAIGTPTANTLKSYGVEVKVLPKNFTFLDMMLELKEILGAKATMNIEYPNL